MIKFDREFNLAGLRLKVSDAGYPVYVNRRYYTEYTRHQAILLPVIVTIENIIHEL